MHLVASVRRMISNLPVITWFAATEVVTSSYGDSSLNLHAHAILTLDTPTGGRGYVRNEAWEERLEESWQSSTRHAFNCCPDRQTTTEDLLRSCCYVTKAADLGGTARMTAITLREPEEYLTIAEAMRGVPRYFGPLASSRFEANGSSQTQRSFILPT